MKNKKSNKIEEKHSWGQRFPLLLGIVIFVFAVLFISVVLVLILYYLLDRYGALPTEITSDAVLNSSFILGTCLVFGTGLTLLVGYFLLKPLNKFVDATKEISGGNFDIKIKMSSPREFARLANSFNDMAKELRSIETLRSDFVSNISHEFKTPVVSIRGFAKLLEKGNLSEEEKAEYLQIIISESDRLTNLSSSVLLLSRLDATDRVDFAPFRLDEQLRRSILLLQPQMDKKNLQVEIALAPTTILANEEMMQHVWINLLNNATKFSGEGGEVHIILQQDQNHALVTIMDTGPGMDEDVLRHVFDKFYQGDTSRASEGSGLGLALVQRILKLNNGTVKVQSAPGQGSAFTVSMPLTKVKEVNNER
ncbi:HAMP domain-containing histidine kinase [Eubacteriales bacterium OttesenSCG-928-K08]|nr:HAMP domain-containing histidine kinase [Eubacteriales bacterium OttesenSCG-928-K08]